jgi:NAD-dependent deacetylase sirtuin 2
MLGNHEMTSEVDLKKLSMFLACDSNQNDDLDWVDKRLSSPTLESMVDYIKNGGCENIVVLCGAGISTAAGIPDFKSPGTGIDHVLEEYGVDDTEDLFTMSIFKKKPQGFFKFARYFTKDIKPTTGHFFLLLLHQKGLLRRIYTQNMDCLEEEAGIPVNKIIQPNGNFNSCVCINKSCQKEYQKSDTWQKIRESEQVVPRCDICKNLLKPDVIFVGQNFPQEFFSVSQEDMHICDLIIVIGTSLTNYPFASLLELVPLDVPRLVINRDKYPPPTQLELTMGIVSNTSAWRFDTPQNYRDVILEGDVDELSIQLADLLGWKEELSFLSATFSSD